MVKKAGRGSDQFVLRLPEGMRDQIRVAAEESGRSMNQEIVEVLQEHFPAPPSDEAIYAELKRVLQWDEDLKTASKRFQIHGLLQLLAKTLEERIPPEARQEPFVYVPPEIMEQVDRYAAGVGTREEAVAFLLHQALARMANPTPDAEEGAEEE